MKKSTWYFVLSGVALVLIGLGYVWMDRSAVLAPDSMLVKKADKKSEQLYEVPKSDLKSDKYVQDTSPSKVGDYTVTPHGVRIALQRRQNIKQTVVSGPVTYQLKQIKVLDNDARTDDAKRMARKSMNLPQLPKHYTSIELHYQITNQSAQKLITDGVATVSYRYGDVVTALGGMVNGSRLANEGVAPGETQAGYVIAYVPKKDTKHLDGLNLEFASTYNESGQQISGKSPKIKVNI